MGSGDVLSVNQAVEGLETARHTRPHRSERSTPFRQPGATQGAPTAIESAQNARPLLGPSPVLSVGWMDVPITIHPSDQRDAMPLCRQDGIVDSTCFEGYRFGYSRGTQRKRSETTLSLTCANYGGPSGVRTLDLGIKSPLLCQLS